MSKKVKVLSIDGGGIRGIIPAMILVVWLAKDIVKEALSNA